MTKVVGKISVPSLPHLGYESLQQGHGDLNTSVKPLSRPTRPTESNLCGNVDEPLVKEEANVAVEKVGDVLQNCFVSPSCSLLQQERPQTSHGLSGK